MSIYLIFLIPQVQHTEKYGNLSIDLVSESHLASYSNRIHQDISKEEIL